MQPLTALDMATDLFGHGLILTGFLTPNRLDWRRGILCPEKGNRVRDFVLEDFDEFFVFVDDFLPGFDLGDALLLIADYADYTNLGIRVYKCMRIYLWSAPTVEGF